MIEITFNGKVRAESIELDTANQAVKLKLPQGELLVLPFSLFQQTEILSVKEYPQAKATVSMPPES